MTAETTPVKPDPHTGFPRPPHAPRSWHGSTPSLRPLGKIRYTLPDEQTWGPPQEWNVGSRRAGWQTAFWAILIVGGFSLFKLRDSFSSADIPLWIFMGGLTAFAGWIFYLAGNREWLLAGALWLQNNKTWVSLYELIEVKASAGGGGQIFTLTDSSGRTLSSLNVMLIQNNQPLWDLIYNGVLFSIHNGTLHPDARAQRVLSLPAT